MYYSKELKRNINIWEITFQMDEIWDKSEQYSIGIFHKLNLIRMLNVQHSINQLSIKIIGSELSEYELFINQCISEISILTNCHNFNLKLPSLFEIEQNRYAFERIVKNVLDYVIKQCDIYNINIYGGGINIKNCITRNLDLQKEQDVIWWDNEFYKGDFDQMKEKWQQENGKWQEYGVVFQYKAKKSWL